MGLQYPPSQGDILICNFPSDFRPPEMVKNRPVIVISPQQTNRQGLATVVPISMTPPSVIETWHCEIPNGLMPPPLQHTAGARWAKCDMMYTLNIDRLEMAEGPKNRATGKRSYHKGKLDLMALRKVRKCIAQGLGVTAELYRDELRDTLKTEILAEYEASKALAKSIAEAS